MPEHDDPIVGLTAAIEAFERAHMKLVDEIEATKSDRQPLREVYAKLYQCIERLKASQGYLIKHLGLEYGVPTVAAGATLERKGGTKRKTWDHQALKSIVSEKILAGYRDPDSGTLTVPPSVLMLDMLNAVSFSAWKVTVLRGLGIGNDTISRYCEEEPGNPSVVVRFPTQSPIPRSEGDETSD